jgi:hypothetical protein
MLLKSFVIAARRCQNLALQNRRSWNLVWLSVTLGLALGIINANKNTRIVLLICTGEADGITSLAAGARYVDLRTAHIELDTHGLAGAMHEGMVKSTQPPLDIMRSTPQLPEPSRPSSKTLNHF